MLYKSVLCVHPAYSIIGIHFESRFPPLSYNIQRLQFRVNRLITGCVCLLLLGMCLSAAGKCSHNNV